MRFRRIDPSPHAVRQFFFEGVTVPFRDGDTVAGALLAAGVDKFRDTPTTGAPRGPYCLMGVCFDCLLHINGAANQRACMTLAADGMRTERPNGTLDLDMPGEEPAR